MEKEGLIEVAAFTYEYEAQLLIGRLEAEGIISYISDNNITAANPFLSNAVGGVKVHVSGRDYQQASELIEMTREEDTSHFKETKRIRVNGVLYKAQIGTCPNCDSGETYVKPAGPFKWFIGILCAMGNFAAPFKHQMFCKACNHNWEM